MIAGFLIAAAATADFVLGLYDAGKTEQGIVKGVAVEGNWFIQKLAGTDKPSVSTLDKFNITLTVVMVAVAVAALYSGNPALIGMAFGELVASAGLHFRGARNWVYLINGGNPLPKQTAFQKFVGFLSWHQ